ncbi:Stress-induced-phosphoprotein 1 [Nymphon striatum]|nr:Stress-induced-phosphoprotein 1 [Nymphon striatum]
MSSNSSSNNSKVNELKESGNYSVKNGNFAEAVLNYTHAIKLDPKQYELYSNRSYAFLKMEQLYFAHEDALATIRLKPDWPKGYFRAGEVEFEAKHYSRAVDSYRRSLHLGENEHVMAKLHKAQVESRKMKSSETQIPWFGMAFGVLFGIILVVADQVLTKSPVLNNPVFQAVVIILLAVAGYLIGTFYRYMIVSQRNSLLEPPPDIFNDGGENPFASEENENSSQPFEKKREATKTHNRKATARQRYQKGKS